MAGELDAFRKGLRARLKALLERYDEGNVWALRSELLALDAFVRANPKAAPAGVRKALDRALDLAATSHGLSSELRGFQGQKDKSESASLFDLGSIGILAVENILTADKITIPRLLMSGLSEALMFLASRQYVAGSREVLVGLYRQHIAAMYRELWALATDYRKTLSAKEVREVQEAIDTFFRAVEADGVPVEARLAVLQQFYALLLVLRTSELLEAIGG